MPENNEEGRINVWDQYDRSLILEKRDGVYQDATIDIECRKSDITEYEIPFPFAGFIPAFKKDESIDV